MQGTVIGFKFRLVSFKYVGLKTTAICISGIPVSYLVDKGPKPVYIDPKSPKPSHYLENSKSYSMGVFSVDD